MLQYDRPGIYQYLLEKIRAEFGEVDVASMMPVSARDNLLMRMKDKGGAVYRNQPFICFPSVQKR
ncbi:hypothetical protein ACLB1Q_08925 [Escherichia coli]